MRFVLREARRLVVGLLALATMAAVTTVAGSVPAYALGSVAITPPTDTVLYPDCYEYTYGYTISAPTADWDVDISITDPFGAQESSDFVYDAEPSTGTEVLSLCGDGIDRPGTYTISATMTWYDADFNKHIEPATSVQFTLAKPATRTTLRVSDPRPAYDQKLRFKTKSTIQGRLGYSRLEYKKVRLEAYRRGAWRKIDTTTTDGDGIARFRYRWNTHRHRVKVRAVTLGTATWTRSASPRITIRVH